MMLMAMQQLLTLASPASGSLGANKALVIDMCLTVTNVTSTTSDGTLKVGDVAAITVTFSEAVTVTGNSQLTLSTASSNAVVDYTSGSGGTTQLNCRLHLAMFHLI